MPEYKVTDLASIPIVSLNDLIHVVDVSDITGDPQGTSTKASFTQIKALLHTSETFTALTDTPANYTGAAGKTVRVNAAGSALEFVTANETFTGLTDTPANYTGAASKTVKVNAAGNALEFTSAGEFTIITITETAAASEPRQGFRQDAENMDADIIYKQSAGVSRLGVFMDDASTGGATTNEYLTIMETGRLGINNINPGARLHVVGNSGTYPLRIDTDVANNQLVMGLDGHIGINTTVPSHRLHIKETVLGTDGEDKNLISLVSEKRSGIRFKDIISSIEYHSGRIVSYYEGISVGETGLRLQLSNTGADSYVDVVRLRSLSTATGKKMTLIRAEDLSPALAAYETALGNDMNNNEMAFYYDGDDLLIQRKDNSGTIKNLTIGTLT